MAAVLTMRSGIDQVTLRLTDYSIEIRRADQVISTADSGEVTLVGDPSYWRTSLDPSQPNAVGQVRELLGDKSSLIEAFWATRT